MPLPRACETRAKTTSVVNMKNQESLPRILRELLRLRLHFTKAFYPSQSMMGWALVIGILGGLSTATFWSLNIGLKWLLTGQSQDLVRIAESLNPSMRLLIPTIGGVLAGIAIEFGHRIAKGGKPKDYLESISLGDGVISAKTTLPRLLSSLLSISSGASIGREGGIVQLAAMLASECGQYFKLSRPRLRLLVACGGAAGLAAAYNTPLAGALFISEIVLQTLAIESLGPLIVSSVTATLVARHWVGMKPIFSASDFAAPVDLAILPVMGLGVVLGILAPTFLLFLDGFRRAFGLLRLTPPLSLGLGGLLVGWISITVPEVWGNGHEMAQALFNEQLTVPFVADVLVFKLMATLLAVGSGAIGGVFTPSLLIGAASGWLFAQAGSLLFSGIPMDPVIYAALGMGAFLAGTTHAPVMAILMIFEMTLNGNLLLPLILATMTARTLSAALHPISIYKTLSTKNQAGRSHHLMPVGEVMATPHHVIHHQAPLESAIQAFLKMTAERLWVIDEEGRYQGHLSIDSLDSRNLSKFEPYAPLVKDLMSRQLTPIKANTPLAEALALLMQVDTLTLPVIADDNRLVGEISRDDILLSLQGRVA